MKVWVVMTSNCEGCSFVCVCESKALAEIELFKKRDEMVAEYKEMHEYEIESHAKYLKETGIDVAPSNMYLKMIENLSGDDYQNWKNFPHDCPFIFETELICAFTQPVGEPNE